MLIKTFTLILKIAINASLAWKLVTTTTLQSLHHILCNSYDNQKNEAYLILENCMVYSKNMSPEQFRHQYLSLYTVSGESFFPVSVFPIYLDLKNFNNTVTLNCISLTITYLQQDTEPENLFFKYENCEFGVKEISDSRKIGIVIPKMLKCCLLNVIDSKRPFSSILNIKVNEKTNDFAVMSIRCFEKNIYVSTFPILNHIWIESNFSYSQVYLDRLQKYKFLHYLYLLTRIRRQDQVKEIVGSSMLRVTTVNINCYTPVFLYRLRDIKTNSFDKQMISVANDPSKPLLVHYSPEYPSLYSDSPITVLKFCYDKSQKGTFKLNFTESINTIDNITHTVLFDFDSNLAGYLNTIGQNKLSIIDNHDRGYIINVYIDTNTDMRNIRPIDFKKIQVKLNSAGYGSERLDLECHIKKCENEMILISIEVPYIFSTDPDFIHTRLHSMLEKKDGFFSLDIYYEETVSSVKVLRHDKYRVCLEYGKIFYLYRKHC